jgi:hypothetical protein
MRLAVLVTAFVLGGAAPALAQSAASEDDPYDPPPVPGAIEVDKTATPASVPEPGGDVTFAVTVAHAAPDAGPVYLTSLVDDVHGDLNGRGTCVLPQTIDPGDDYGCSFSAYVGGVPGFVETDTISATGVDSNGDPVSDRDAAAVTVLDVPSLLTVEKDVSSATVPETGDTVTFDVTIANDAGVLGRICTLIGEQDANISDLKFIDRKPDYFRLLIDVDLRDAEHLHRVQTALDAESNVSSISRHRDPGLATPVHRS